MPKLIGLEVRTFTQRFGSRCPFCGEPWSSEKKCGPRSQGDYTIQDSLKLLFSDRTGECQICSASITADRKHCFDCARPRRLAQNRMKTARYRENHQVQLTCQYSGCGAEFSTHKKDQKYCSISCGNRARHQRLAA